MAVTAEKHIEGAPGGGLTDAAAAPASRTAALADHPAAGCDSPEASRSALYACTVMHHRLSPKEHRFVHRIFLLLLDLDDLPETAGRITGFTHNRRGVFEFRDRDHLTLPACGSAPLRDHLLAWLRERGAPLPAEVRVSLLTLPRVFGYVFNPVSFYFVREAATGRPLHAVAEVRNTFGELKPYLLPPATPDGRFVLRAPKHFYVSPFSSLDLTFQFDVRLPGDHLDIRVDDFDGEAPVLRSALTGSRQPLTTASLWRASLACPLVTLKVTFLIHWHALRLWLKKIPWHPKAAHPELQRDHFSDRPTPTDSVP